MRGSRSLDNCCLNVYRSASAFNSCSVVCSETNLSETPLIHETVAAMVIDLFGKIAVSLRHCTHSPVTNDFYKVIGSFNCFTK